MKTSCFIFLLIALTIVSCADEGSGFITSSPNNKGVDTIPPVMTLVGRNIDTAYLQAEYKDPGVTLLDNIDGQLRCTMSVSLEVSGTVNNRLPGAYVLTYNATDVGGNHPAPLTRTVHVVENSAAFLNGTYTVACTCTIVPATGAKTITSNNYSAVVSPGSRNSHFMLIGIDVGREKLVPYTRIVGDSIEGDFWNADYAASTLTGTLSSSKNSFTIESTAYPFSPKVTYKCKNIFTRQLLAN